MTDSLPILIICATVAMLVAGLVKTVWSLGQVSTGEVGVDRVVPQPGTKTAEPPVVP